MGALTMVLVAALLITFGWLGRAALGHLRDLSRSLTGILATVQEGMQGPGADVETRFRDLEDMVDRLPARWEEIKREATRLDGRARYSVARAREELAASGLVDERLEDLGRELHLIDGDGGADGGVHAVRDPLAEAQGAVGHGVQPDPDDWHQAALRAKGLIA